MVTEDGTERVLYSATGRSNPDLDGSWAVAFLPPDRVRIVNRDSPPDIEFHGTESGDDARRHRRIDPRRLAAELERAAPSGFIAEVVDGRLGVVRTTADLPLRGRVPVVWRWDWSQPERPALELLVDETLLFRGRGSWRELDAEEAAALWEPTPGEDPIEVPGEQWPARARPRLVEVADGVHLARGVRTGFQHLVVETEQGLVVADAPAGWVEIHQIPPTDLVPGLGISGLSERFVDFLLEQWPGREIRAVALTHAHDDHAGGARAFVAAGAEVWAPAAVAVFLDRALDDEAMPEDRLARQGESVRVRPVSEVVRLDDPERPVELHPIGPGPHAVASLGVYAPKQKVFFVSDLHVPGSEADAPPADRAVTECWFARWAVEHLPSDAVVVNSHSAVSTPVSRLAAYLDSDVCRQG